MINVKQIREDTLCKYCFGCNKLAICTFEGVRNCKDFIASDENWKDRYERSLKGG